MKLYAFIILTIALLGQYSCSKKDPLGPQVINNSLIFVIKKNNQRLPDSVLNNIKMSFYQNGSKQYVSDLIRAVNEGPFNGGDLGIMATRNIGSTSGDNGIKNYYLEYPDGTRDTLFVDYRHVTYKEAAKNNCYCYYPLETFTYNGQVPAIDSSVTIQKVYIFKKR